MFPGEGTEGCVSGFFSESPSGVGGRAGLLHPAFSFVGRRNLPKWAASGLPPKAG